MAFYNDLNQLLVHHIRQLKHIYNGIHSIGKVEYGWSLEQDKSTARRLLTLSDLLVTESKRLEHLDKMKLDSHTDIGPVIRKIHRELGNLPKKFKKLAFKMVNEHPDDRETAASMNKLLEEIKLILKDISKRLSKASRNEASATVIFETMKLADIFSGIKKGFRHPYQMRAAILAVTNKVRYETPTVVDINALITIADDRRLDSESRSYIALALGNIAKRFRGAAVLNAIDNTFDHLLKDSDDMVRQAVMNAFMESNITGGNTIQTIEKIAEAGKISATWKGYSLKLIQKAKEAVELDRRRQ